MIITLAISGYRSIRDLALPMAPLTVITGSNGVGKSSLYRSLRLLGAVAQGGAIRSLAAEGGLEQVLWAGPEEISRAMKAGEEPVQGTLRRGPVALRLGFASEDYGYAVDLGLPASGSAFPNDPEIKAEAVWVGDALRRHNQIALRAGPAVRVRDAQGAWGHSVTALAPFDSMMTHAADPKDASELLYLRDRMRNWRFYDHLRTDREAPARHPRIGTRTPVLANDGADLAAAILTIRDIGDGHAFDRCIADAFPGSVVEVAQTGGLFEVQMRQPGLLRPLSAAELSDGTLRFLLLATALLSPRPPALMVLNEPETSLHPDLIPALARLITLAAQQAQVVVVTHDTALSAALAQAHADSGGQATGGQTTGGQTTGGQTKGGQSTVGEARLLTHHLSKELGETVVETAEPVGWTWPDR